MLLNDLVQIRQMVSSETAVGPTSARDPHVPPRLVIVAGPGDEDEDDDDEQSDDGGDSDVQPDPARSGAMVRRRG